MDYCHLHELEVAAPEIAKALMEKREYDDGLYWYKLTKRGYVYRLLSREGKKAYNLHGYAEHPKPAPNDNQLTLEAAVK